MDDIRNRYKVPRRDYAGPMRRGPAQHRALTERPMFAPQPAAQPIRPQAAPVRQLEPEPAPFNPPRRPMPEPQAPPAARRHTRRKKRSLLKPLIILLVLAGLGAGGFFGYQKLRVQNPFPDDIRSQSKLDLLYPAKLPAGYNVNKQDMSLSNGVLIYDATDNDNHRLVFTIQAAPANFDFNAFYRQQLANNQQYPTSLGTAVIGKNSNRPLGSLVDDDTWLLLSTNSADVTINDMALVLKNLKHY